MSDDSDKESETKEKVNSDDLTPEEIDQCRKVFRAIQKNDSKTIDVGELNKLMQMMGQKIDEDEIYRICTQVDSTYSNSINES